MSIGLCSFIIVTARSSTSADAVTVTTDRGGWLRRIGHTRRRSDRNRTNDGRIRRYRLHVPSGRCPPPYHSAVRCPRLLLQNSILPGQLPVVFRCPPILEP